MKSTSHRGVTGPKMLRGGWILVYSLSINSLHSFLFLTFNIIKKKFKYLFFKSKDDQDA